MYDFDQEERIWNLCSHCNHHSRSRGYERCDFIGGVRSKDSSQAIAWSNGFEDTVCKSFLQKEKFSSDPPQVTFRGFLGSLCYSFLEKAFFIDSDLGKEDLSFIGFRTAYSIQCYFEKLFKPNPTFNYTPRNPPPLLDKEEISKLLQELYQDGLLTYQMSSKEPLSLDPYWRVRLQSEHKTVLYNLEREALFGEEALKKILVRYNLGEEKGERRVQISLSTLEELMRRAKML